jgi:hypothetical protein
MIRQSFFDEIDSTPTASFRVALRELLLDTWDEPQTLIHTELTPTQLDARRRWPIIAVAAAAVVLLVAALVVATRSGDPTGHVPAERPTTEVARRVGFPGLPPEGTPPSTPERGQFVLDISLCSSGPNDGFSVFADGRLISSVSNRLVEQRLTPEGVELIRSEFLASGLLGTHDDECVEGGYHGHVDNGELHGDGFSAPPDELVSRLADPWSWLPASAWEDGEIKAFVASEYSVLIYGASGGSTSIHPSDPAPELPTAVQELVRAERWECQSLDPPWEGYCYAAFTTDEVRAFAAGLDAAAYVAETAGGSLDYNPDDGTSVQVSVRPRLPGEVCDCPSPG